MKDLFDLRNKIALVTGSGRGLGAAMARGLAEYGASVVVADIDLEAAGSVAEDIKANQGTALAVQVDVTDAESVQTMADKIVGAFGKIDILVNNAGINRRNPCVQMSEQDWDSVINVNLKGTFLCTRAVGKVMLEQKHGKVINIASLLSTVAQPDRSPYAASKGGVVQFTKVLALEWAKSNISVNAIGPGYFMTELNTALMDNKEMYDELTSRIPMGRWAQPEELIGALVFLSSDASDYITGQVVYVDGGYLCY